jgi:hypothetical protein
MSGYEVTVLFQGRPIKVKEPTRPALAAKLRSIAPLAWGDAEKDGLKAKAREVMGGTA